MDIKTYWNNLQEQERRALIVGVVTVSLLLFYSLLWQPVGDALENSQHEVRELHQQHLWMQQAATEARRLNQGNPVISSRGKSLLTVIDSSARKYQIKKAVSRMQPESESRIRVWLEDASFDALLGWLDSLTAQGIHVLELTVERSNNPGVVSAELILESHQ